MPLSNPNLPTSLMEYSRSILFDNATAFCQNQTLTATGYLSNIQTQVDIGQGRFTGYLVLKLSALDLSSNDETYHLFLLGSNDSAFGNGNVDTLAVQDFAAPLLAVCCQLSGVWSAYLFSAAQKLPLREVRLSLQSAGRLLRRPGR